MQRTRRRGLCSTGSVSSPSDSTIRPRRRTSSAGGDCSAPSVSEDVKKSSSTQHHMRSKASKKTSKASKSVRPTFGSFQNTIVLAPFHTLKKCFQSKLMDLYNNEKMKKINHKKKMAKNTSFEYEVIELNPSDQNPKKEEPAEKCGHIEKAEKKKRSRSQSYCQCRKSEREKCQKSSKEIWKRSTRSGLKRKPSTPDCRHPSGKRRRLGNQPLAHVALKIEPRDRSLSKDLVCGRRSDLSASALSSRSWETFSDSRSCREERLEGSLAISTTSFDSSLEQTDRYSATGRLKHDSRLKTGKRKSRDSVTKSKPGASRHLIPMKSSDGQITDFADREPQTQAVSSGETTRHLHPLRRQSRTKVRQQNASAKPKPYRLRSAGAREITAPADGRQTRQPQPYGPGRGQSFPANESGIGVHIEVGTQVEGNFGQGDATKHETSTNIMLLQSGPDSISLLPVRAETPEESADREETAAERSPELPCEIHHKQQSEPESDGNGSKAVEQDGWDGEIIEPCVLIKEHPDLPSPQKIPGSSSQQPEDKEPNFIFGNRNATTRLGESCEFSFGLNWVFSDDEDSDHADRYC